MVLDIFLGAWRMKYQNRRRGTATTTSYKEGSPDFGLPNFWRSFGTTLQITNKAGFRREADVERNSRFIARNWKTMNATKDEEFIQLHMVKTKDLGGRQGCPCTSISAVSQILHKRTGFTTTFRLMIVHTQSLTVRHQLGLSSIGSKS